VPGTYQVRLTVDGKAQSQPLTIVMDPRSPATAETLAQQLQLGLQIFAETTAPRHALAEIASVQKQLADAQKKVEETATAQNAPIKAELSGAQSTLAKIVMNKDAEQDGPGLQEAYAGLVSALRVVESGDRAVPSQAIAVYEQLSPQVKTRLAEWARFKQTNLPQLNQKLHEANLDSIVIGEK
jgi:hypothetical protein